MRMTPQEAKQQKTLLQSYFEEKKAREQESVAGLKIIGDYREKASLVMKELIGQNVQLELKQLNIGDYQLSDRVVVEYKQVTNIVFDQLTIPVKPVYHDNLNAISLQAFGPTGSCVMTP